MAAEEALRKKAEAKHFSYMGIPTDSQRYRFMALNEMGRMMVDDVMEKGADGIRE